MKINLPKIVSFVVLIAVVFMFTGLSTAISAAHQEKAEKSCCDECNNDESKSPDHCSTPDCPLFLCLSVNVVTPFMPSISLDGVYIPQSAKETPLKSFVKSIFHPPATV